MRSLGLRIAGLALLSCATAVLAQDASPTPVAPPAPVATVESTAVPVATTEADQSAAVMAVVVDFHRAIEEGYREGAVRLLDEKVIVFETGYVEVNRDEYAGGHLGADMQYAMTVKREIVHSQTMVSGNVAVALSQTRSKGEFAGKKINLTNTETMVLRLGPDGWKIAHIHWSGHELKDVPPAP